MKWISAAASTSPWDRHSPYRGTGDYSKSCNGQLTELMTNYGRIGEVWRDGAGSKETPYDRGIWAHTVRNLQPNAVIFGSLGATPYVECRWVGNESGYAGNPNYSTVNAHALEVEATPVLNSGEFGGIFIPSKPYALTVTAFGNTSFKPSTAQAGTPWQRVSSLMSRWP